MSDFQTAPRPPAAGHSRRAFRPRQFLLGLLFSCTGVSLVLSVAFLTDTVRTVTGTLSIPAICTSLLLAILCIGTGFALMSTAMATFDESEFDRLASAGNISAFEHLSQQGSAVPAPPDETVASGCSASNRVS